MATLKTRLILRNDVTAKWADVVLLKGEAGVEWYTGTGDSNGNQVKDSGETAAKPKIKIGDGFTKWSDLPYIQDGFINTTVGTSGTGNTVVGASVSYNASTGVYSITLNKANRVVDIEVADDNIVDLEVAPNWNETDGTNKGHKITASHKTYHTGTLPSTTATTAGDVAPTADHTINVPSITIDKYGHTTAIGNQAVTIKAHDITLTEDTAEAAAEADAVTVVGISKGGNHEIKYVEGYRLTRKDTTELTANTILLGNGGYDVKTSSKTISALDNGTIGSDHTTIPTSKTVKGYVDAKVASAVHYLGVVSAVTGLSTTAGKGDFYRASADFSYTNSKLSKTVQVHAGDLIVALQNNPSRTLDIVSDTSDDSTAGWGVIHGEEIGVANIEAADASILVTGTAANPKIQVNTGFTTNNTNRNYKVQLAADNSGLFVNVPWLNTEYGVATSTDLGLVKLGSDAKQTTTVNGVSNTVARTYAVQLNNNNQMVVNIPWTDNRDAGYGKITPANSTVDEALDGNDTQIIAGTYSENVKFSAANKWIVLAGTNSDTAGSDEMKWGHILSGVTAGTYGQSTAKTLVWKEGDADTFTVVNPTVDRAGHITGINNITITAPNTTVTTGLRGLAPKITKTNSFLVATNGATEASWEKVLIIDGGSATTTEWGTISIP
jgi:hypothetical protein